MTFTATRQNQKSGRKPATKAPSSAQAAPPAPIEVKPILGVDLKGELIDVALDHVIDPAGPSDRLARPGDEAAIEQLARSMGECGQLQPVMLERLVDGRFCRVFGRRRIAAARRLGWTTIRASVVPPLPDDVRRTVVAIENVQRQDLSPAEETLAVDELMQLQAVAAARQLGKPLLEGCGAWSGRMIDATGARDMVEASAKEQAAVRHDLLLDHRVRAIASELVAAMLGKPASWVRDRLYIGRLSEKSKALVLTGKLPLAHAREISKVADEKRREDLCRAYAAGGSDSISDVEAGKLEELQMEVRRSVFALHVVPWQRHVAFAGRQPCDGCPHNSATNPGLFEGGGDVSLSMVGGRGTYASESASSEKIAAAGICTMPACYADKLRAAKAAISAASKRIVDSGKKPADAKVPEYVAPAALDRKVRERRSLHGPKGKKEAQRRQAERAPSRQQLEAEARRKAATEWAEAMRKRAQEIEPKIAGKIMATPGLWSVYMLFRKTKIYEGTHHYSAEKAARAANSPAMVSLLKTLAAPNWAAICKIEKDCGRRFGLLDAWRDGPSGMADKIARALGIEVGEPPTLESFLPKDLRTPASESPAPKPGAASKSSAPSKAARSAKRSGGKASVEPSGPSPERGHPIVDDGEDEE